MFGYPCALCNGSYYRCGKVHDYCTRCVFCKHCKSSTCPCLQCDSTGHLESTCEGGPQCWEKDVYCIVNDNYYSDLGTSFYGIYDGYGKVIPEKKSKYSYVLAEVYKDKDIPVTVMCKSCYITLLENDKINKLHTKMLEDVSLMDNDEYNEYQNFVVDNILDLTTL
jgi:hypothetical protein